MSESIMLATRSPALASAAAQVDRGVRLAACGVCFGATITLAVTWLLLVVTFALAAMPDVPSGYWWPTLLALVCVGNALAAGYFHVELLECRWPRLACVMAIYALVLASGLGIENANSQLFVGLASLSIPVGAALAHLLHHRLHGRVAKASERLPKLLRWFGSSARFWSVFLLGYVGLGIAVHDLLACLADAPRFVY